MSSGTLSSSSNLDGAPLLTSRDNSDDERLANDVANLVVETYLKLPQKFRVKSTEWTVLSGIVAELGESGEELVLVSLGTGTKCLGDAELVDGYVVRDCHAETMARRGLNNVLMEEMSSIIAQRHAHSTSNSDKKELPETVLLEPIAGNSEGDFRFRLKPNVRLHLFISDSPCGCASEYARVEGDSRRITGAKRYRLSSSEALSAEGTRNVDDVDDDDNLRTKSGRSDLPKEKRTRCMSCSDKVMKWAAIGFQSSLACLMGLIVPVRPHSIILSRDAVLGAYEDPSVGFANDAALRQDAIDEVRSALENSLSRLKRCPGYDVNLLPRVRVAKTVGFPQSRQRIDPPMKKTVGDSLSSASKPAPSSGVALSWIVKGGGPRRERCGAKAGGGMAETLVGVRGVREGASKTASSRLVCSDLCKAAWLKRYMEHVTLAGDVRTYGEVKQSKPTWHRQLVDEFRKTFPGWNVNERFDNFILE